MRNLVLCLSIIALAANIVPAALYLAGRMELDAMKSATLWATIAWYIVGSVLIYGTKPADLDEPVSP